MSPEVLSALLPVLDAFEALGVRCYLRRWADAIGVLDLLERVLLEAR